MSSGNLSKTFPSSAKLAPEESSSTINPSAARSTFAKLRSKITETIDETESEEKPKNVLETMRIKFKDFIYHTWFGRSYEQLMLFISVLSSFEYIYKTYIDTAINDNDGSQMKIIEEFELFLALACAFDWFINFFIADHRILFMTSFFSIIDILTIVSILTTRSHTCPLLRLSNTRLENTYYVLCGVNTTRILRALKFQKRFDLIEDEVQRFLAKMCLNIIIMILFNSALMQYLETDQDYLFHTWMYYMLVTVTTVGYGDISPRSDLGRFAAMGMISYAIITVPQMTNELIEKMTMQSVYARARFIPKSMDTKHILLCGDLTATSLTEFFEELFHEDHDIDNLHCVILQPSTPSKHMLSILKNPSFGSYLTYLEGNPMNDHDLSRALASRAKAVFIMTNKFSRSADEEDCKTILQQFAIQRHLRLSTTNAGKTKTMFYLQLIRPENKRHLVTNHLSMENDALDLTTSTKESMDSKKGLDNQEGNLVICLNEIKMGVIAKGVLFPGANTLLMNLLTSFADDDDETGHHHHDPKEVEGIETLEEDEGSGDWLGEYQRGCDWEIYTTELSESFEGTSFCYLSEILYHKLGIILIGVEVKEIKRGNRHKETTNAPGKKTSQIYLNPADFVIPPKTDYHVIGFVIAKNKAQSDLTFSKAHHEHGLLSVGSASVPEHNLFHANLSQLSTLSNAITNRVASNVLGWKPDITKEHRSASITPENDRVEKERKQAWQSLLKSRENRKTQEMIQEELQLHEERQLRKHYFLREQAIVNSTDLADVYIPTSLSEEMPYVDNHIIVVAKALNNLYDLIRPLRARNLGVLKHIVILYPYDFPLQIWQRIRIFEAIWIVRGNALEEADIRRCGIFKAKQVILLADASTASRSSSSGDSSSSSGGNMSTAHGATDALVDADIVFCYQAIKRMNENAHVIVEMIRHSNVSYLDPESGLNSSNIDYKFTSQFASGSLFTTSILDTLVCQAFYNTKVIEILNQMIGGQEHNEQEVLAASEKATSEATNAEQQGIKKSASTGSLKGGSSHKSSAASLKGLMGSALYQINLPEGLQTRTYGALYRLLARRKQIPLGILRGVFAHTKSGPKANKMPYVYTNPPKDTELFSCDKIFVLSQTPVKITRVTKDETRELQIYTTLRSKRKTAEDILNVVNTLRQEMKSYQDHVTEREEQVQGFHYDMLQKVNAMIASMERLQQIGGVEGCGIMVDDGKAFPPPRLSLTRSRSNSMRVPAPLGSPPSMLSTPTMGGSGGTAARKSVRKSFVTPSPPPLLGLSPSSSSSRKSVRKSFNQGRGPSPLGLPPQRNPSPLLGARKQSFTSPSMR